MAIELVARLDDDQRAFFKEGGRYFSLLGPLPDPIVELVRWQTVESAIVRGAAVPSNSEMRAFRDVPHLAAYLGERARVRLLNELAADPERVEAADHLAVSELDSLLALLEQEYAGTSRYDECHRILDALGAPKDEHLEPTSFGEPFLDEEQEAVVAARIDRFRKIRGVRDTVVAQANALAPRRHIEDDSAFRYLLTRFNQS